MSDISWTGGRSPARSVSGQQPQGGANLADLLERILDKGIVIVGDIRVNLLDIELLTIKLRLLVASVDRAKEMGIDWWEHDPSLSSGARKNQAAAGDGGAAAVQAEAEPARLTAPDGSDEHDELLRENRLLRERLAALEAAAEPEDDRPAATRETAKTASRTKKAPGAAKTSGASDERDAPDGSGDRGRA